MDAAAAVPVNKDNFYDVNRRWLRSDWVEKRAHLWLDLRGDAPSSLARLAANALVPDNSLAASAPAKSKANDNSDRTIARSSKSPARRLSCSA